MSDAELFRLAAGFALAAVDWVYGFLSGLNWWHVFLIFALYEFAKALDRIEKAIRNFTDVYLRQRNPYPDRDYWSAGRRAKQEEEEEPES